LIAVGRAVGEITMTRRGQNGFGFDPVMYLPEVGQTFAEMSTALKNQLSHRGQAARQMIQLIHERWLN
jgi:XTP/dITP diphosphohydrolase